VNHPDNLRASHFSERVRWVLAVTTALSAPAHGMLVKSASAAWHPIADQKRVVSARWGRRIAPLPKVGLLPLHGGLRMKITVTGALKLPDIDRRWIDIDCPTCRLATPASLGDVRLGNVIICRGCKLNIRLIDHIGEYHRMRRKLEQTLGRALAAFTS
jgi:hypothetical protein